jgi:hypothetical protein
MGAKLSTPQPVDGNSAVTNRISKHHESNALPGHRFKSVGRSVSSNDSATMEPASQSKPFAGALPRSKGKTPRNRPRYIHPEGIARPSPINVISIQDGHRKESNATEKTETKISKAFSGSPVFSDHTLFPTKQQHPESGFREIIACGGIVVEATDDLFEADVSAISSSGSHRKLPGISAKKDNVRVLESSSNCQKGSACSTPHNSNTRIATNGNTSTRPIRLSASATEFIPSTIATKRTTSSKRSVKSSTVPPVNAADSTRQQTMGTVGNCIYNDNLMTPVRATKADTCYGIDPPGSVVFVQPRRVACLTGLTHGEDKRVAIQSPPSARFPRLTSRSHPGMVNLPVPIVAKPRVFHCKGVRVTMLDDDCKIFVIDLVPRSVTELILQMTEDHLRRAEVNKGVKETWRTLYTYTKMDLPCSEIDHLQIVTDEIVADVVEVIGEIFRDPDAAKSLKPRSWKEPHLLRYQKVDGKPDHTGVEMHFDGSHFTWQLMLSDEDDYEGASWISIYLRSTTAQ